MIGGAAGSAGTGDERWALVERCFATALDTPAEEREQRLVAECADELVRADVRRLVARHEALSRADGADDFLVALDLDHAVSLLAGDDPDEPLGVGRYQITRTLGRGATGVVYLAYDPALGREVAVKVLSSALSGDRGAVRRFEQEARTASALDHPRVVPIHEIGRTADGRLFIAMAYRDGTTLRERLAHGPLPLGEAVSIAAEIAEGLAAAHAKGIVHRDVKPENILLNDRGACLVDFGIAKIAGQSLTRTGAALGTTAYMSPEQTLGTDVDGRTDLWAVGVVLYEMLAGSRPFRAEGGDALVYAVRHDPPVRLGHVRRDVPPAIADVVRRCLEKEPANRFTRAEELAAALRAPWDVAPRPQGARVRHVALAVVVIGAVAGAGAAVAATRRTSPQPPALASGTTTARTAAIATSIAFAPFTNGSRDDRRYLTEGLSGEVMLRLVRVPGLRVAAPEAWRVASRDETDVRTVGARLRVTAVLRGTVRHGEERMNAAVELVRTADGRVIWSKTYDARGDEGVRVAEAISRDVVRTLRGGVTSSSRLVAVRASDDPVAYDLYLRGRFAYNRGTPEGLAEAATYFREAIGRDSGFARPYVGLADVYSAPQTSNPATRIQRAKPLVAHALARDSMLAEAHRAAGWIAMWYDRDWVNAERHLRRALALDPSDIWNYHALAAYQSAVGRNDESLETTRAAMALDPVSSATATHLGLHLFWLRRYDESIAVMERALRVDTTWNRTKLVLARAYLAVGRYDDALANLRKPAYGYAAFDPEAVLTYALGVSGHTEEARARTARLTSLARATYVRPIDLVVAHLGLGDTARALDWAERIPDDRGSMFFLISEPIFDPIRETRRFGVVLERLGLTEAARRANAVAAARGSVARRR
jgi:serine/threonine-protein kinase